MGVACGAAHGGSRTTTWPSFTPCDGISPCGLKRWMWGYHSSPSTHSSYGADYGAARGVGSGGAAQLAANQLEHRVEEAEQEAITVAVAAIVYLAVAVETFETDAEVLVHAIDEVRAAVVG